MCTLDDRLLFLLQINGVTAASSVGGRRRRAADVPGGGAGPISAHQGRRDPDARRQETALTGAYRVHLTAAPRAPRSESDTGLSNISGPMQCPVLTEQVANLISIWHSSATFWLYPWRPREMITFGSWELDIG